MSKERECGEMLRKIAGGVKFDTFAATVKSVDIATCVVERLVDNKSIDGVRLNASLKDNEGVIIRPERNSIVIVTSIDGENYFVAQYSAIDTITITAAGNIELNGGSNGGLVLSKTVQSELEKVINRVNSIVQALTKIGAQATATGSAPVVGTALGTLVSGNISGLLSPLISPSQQSFENDKILH